MLHVSHNASTCFSLPLYICLKVPKCQYEKKKKKALKIFNYNETYKIFHLLSSQEQD